MKNTRYPEKQSKWLTCNNKGINIISCSSRSPKEHCRITYSSKQFLFFAEHECRSLAYNYSNSTSKFVVCCYRNPERCHKLSSSRLKKLLYSVKFQNRNNSLTYILNFVQMQGSQDTYTHKQFLSSWMNGIKHSPSIQLAKQDNIFLSHLLHIFLQQGNHQTETPYSADNK